MEFAKIRVQAPFIIAKIAGVEFGKYSRGDKVKADNSFVGGAVYPNFVSTLQVKKFANGAVNQYTLVMVYQITRGDDPNFLEALFSQADRQMLISYGDMSQPLFIFKEESVMITKIDRAVDIKGSKISYTIHGTSNTGSLGGAKFTFPAKTAKPSTEIQNLIKGPYGLGDILTGMRNWGQVEARGLVTANDIPVKLECKDNYTALEYLDYLVRCMHNSNDITGQSLYVLAYEEDQDGSMGGPYIRITETAAVETSEGYTVEIGYPDDYEVYDFQVSDNNLYSLVFANNGKMDAKKHIDNMGNVKPLTTNKLMEDKNLKKILPEAISWWQEVVSYPISATLKVRGWIKPAVICSKLRLNVSFYGMPYNFSGAYMITEQTDDVGANGFYTTFGLKRIGG